MAQESTTPIYKRIVLKITGESFCEEGGFGINGPELEDIARQCVDVAKLGVQLAIVVGGGNFIRGATFAQAKHIQRATADYMGMLSTVLNGVALQETMEALGQPARVMSAFPVSAICEPYLRRRAIRHLEKGRVVILTAGTGNPFFTTDTCAALRATEVNADVLLKATKVDGIYTADPMKDPSATKYDTITYQEAISRQLKVMDQTAFTLAMERKMPVVVFSMREQGNIARVVCGENIGTHVVAG